MIYRRYEISSGTIFDNSKEIITFLRDKFSPPYNVVEIEVGLLNERREAARRKVFNTVDGSSKFHVLLFRPNQTTFKAAPQLCVCDDCKVSIGSCSLFSDHTIQVGELNPTHLRSEDTRPTGDIGKEAADDFIVADTFIAVAPDTNSPDIL